MKQNIFFFRIKKRREQSTFDSDVVVDDGKDDIHTREREKIYERMRAHRSACI